jgi:hypothetical protein
MAAEIFAENLESQILFFSLIEILQGACTDVLVPLV